MQSGYCSKILSHKTRGTYLSFFLFLLSVILVRFFIVHWANLHVTQEKTDIWQHVVHSATRFPTLLQNLLVSLMERRVPTFPKASPSELLSKSHAVILLYHPSIVPSFMCLWLAISSKRGGQFVATAVVSVLRSHRHWHCQSLFAVKEIRFGQQFTFLLSRVISPTASAKEESAALHWDENCQFFNPTVDIKNKVNFPFIMQISPFFSFLPLAPFIC